MMEDWLSALNSGSRIGLLLVDLCKAFDLVNHTLLIRKLKLYKCNTTTLNWFKSYISDRQQSVQIQDIASDPLEIKSGVPQGSILGPLLFIIFINDIFLEDGLGDIDIFADDAVAHQKGSSKEEINNKLQQCADSFQGWCLRNYMVLSIEKTKTMYISNRQNSVQNFANSIKINDISIEEVDLTKLLGITISNTLSWDRQVGQVKKCASYRLSLLRKIRKYLPFETRILFYNYYVKPTIEYCSSIWGNCSKHNTLQVIKIQKKAARLILDVDPLTPSKLMFQKLQWLPFDEIVKFKQSCLVFKAVNGDAPPYIQNMFINARDHTEYTLRSSTNSKLFVPRTHHNSLSYTGVAVWNTLPENVKSAETFDQFKKFYVKLTLDKLKRS